MEVPNRTAAMVAAAVGGRSGGGVEEVEEEGEAVVVVVVEREWIAGVVLVAVLRTSSESERCDMRPNIVVST